MTRTRWLLLILVLAAVGVGVAVAVAPGDDSGSGSGSGSGGSGGSGGSAARVTTTTPAAATVAPATTVAPASTASPTTTVAVPGECGSVGGAIRVAVDAGVQGASTGADVTECRLAASDTSWALVKLAPRSGSSFAATTVILQGGGGAWSVVGSGGTDAGCGKAPQQVIADLGQFCVGSGGGAR